MVKKTRKRQVIRRNEVTQTFDGELRKFYSDWETLCKGLSREDIGITGAKGGKNLYDMVLNHVSSAVQRPNSPNAGNRDGANYEVMDELKKIMTTNELITVGDLNKVKELVTVLNKMSSNNSDLNPANIPFNVRFRRGRGRTVSKEIYGHYRTDDYVAIRNADPKKKDETIRAVDDSWWSMSKDGSARPPMYQALFGDGDKIDEKDSLTGVLDKLTKSLPSAKIPFLDIKVNYDPSDLSKIPEFKKTLDDLVKSPAIKGKDGKVSPTKLQRQLQNSKIQITSKTSSDLIKDVAGLVGDNEVLGQVEAFSITLTKNMLKRYAGQFDFELKKSWMDMLR
jgi:hypothetical protein